MLFFSRWPGTATAHTSKFVGIQLKKKHLRDVGVSQTCVSSEMELILARIGLFGDYEGRDFTMYLKYRAQLGFGFVNASILLIRNGKHGVEREVRGEEKTKNSHLFSENKELSPRRVLDRGAN